MDIKEEDLHEIENFDNHVNLDSHVIQEIENDDDYSEVKI